MSDKLHPFQVLARPQAMRDWLSAQRLATVRTMSSTRDMVDVYRAQGQVQLLDQMLALLDKAAGQ